MLEFLLQKLLPSTLRLLMFIGLGVFVGCLLENSRLGKKLAVLGRPFARWSRLPSTCASAFAMAFVSPRAANAMLAGAQIDGHIGRGEMITGALANTFPNTFLHLRTMSFVLIPLLGISGLAYIGFQIASGLCCTLMAVAYARVRYRGVKAKGHVDIPDNQPLTFREMLLKARKRTAKIMKRVLTLTVPLYIIIGLLDHYGLFARLREFMPEAVNQALAPASISVLAAHMSNITNAASVASKLLESGTLTQMDVFITLLIGYALSVPMRMARHSIPSAVGTFPGRDGLRIVFIQQGMRLLLALLAITALIQWRLS